MPITITPELGAFFDCLLTTDKNILLKATAGSGKTTAIIEACKRAPQPARVVLLAFSRDIADVLQAKMPYYAIANTFHAFCNSMIKRQLGKMEKPDGRKCAKILKELVPNWKDRKDWEDDFLTLCSRAKAFACFAEIPGYQPPPITEVRDRFALDVPDIGLVEDVLHRSLLNRTLLDFDDMLLHALVYQIPFDRMDYLFVDEAQDTNVVQALLLERMVGGVPIKEEYGQVSNKYQTTPKRARIVAVGDPHQAIYGFRGADADALASLATRFSMVEMPLSVTYRCSQAVVEEARKWERLGLGHSPQLQSNLDPDEEESQCPHYELDHGICIDCGEDRDPNSNTFGEKN